jgi:hypothetical protein
MDLFSFMKFRTMMSLVLVDLFCGSESFALLNTQQLYSLEFFVTF